MSKITLNNVGSLIDSTTAANTINANSATVQTAFDNTLSRDGTSPNQMESNLDMNNFQILNLPNPATADSPLRLQDLATFNGGGTISSLPAGGTQGTVLTKNSSTDYDISWQPQDVLELECIADMDITYNDTNAQYNTNLLITALATKRAVRIPYTTFGYSFRPFTMLTTQVLIGENQVLIKGAPTTGNAFITVQGLELVANPILIQSFNIDMTYASTGTTAIRMGTASNIVSGVRIYDILFSNCYEAIGDQTPLSTSYTYDLRVTRCNFVFTRGRQIFLRKTRGEIFFEDIHVDNQQNPGQTVPVTWEGARFSDFVGLAINRYEVTGPTPPALYSSGTAYLVGNRVVGSDNNAYICIQNSTGHDPTSSPSFWTSQGSAYISSQVGLNIIGGTGNSTVWLNEILVDNTCGDGVYVSGVNYLDANWITAFQNLGNQFLLTNVSQSNISNILCNGAITAFPATQTTVPGAPSGAVGLGVSGCTYCNFSNINSTLNTGDAISIVNSTDCNYTNVTASKNNTYGIHETGTSTRNLITNCILDNNTTSNISTVGAATQVVNYTASGTYIGTLKPWNVASGGTGLSTLTNHSLQVGAATASPTQLAVGATGTVLIGNTGADPSFSSTPAITATNITGTASMNINGTVGATTPTTGAFTTVNKVTITQPASSATLTIANGKTLTASNTLTLTGPDSTSWAFPATSATGAVVTDDSTATFTNKTFNSTATGNSLQVSGVAVSRGQFPGENSTGSATAGNIGEYVSSTIVSGSAVALTSNTPVNVTSISLTAGDWDVTFEANFNGASTTTLTNRIASISTTTGTLNTTPGQFSTTQDNGTAAYNNVTGTIGLTQTVGPVRVSIASTTTVFAVAQSLFGVSTSNAFGVLRARRVR